MWYLFYWVQFRYKAVDGEERGCLDVIGYWGYLRASKVWSAGGGGVVVVVTVVVTM